MRARCFHYWTSRLALAAALLLVLAPVGTRLLAATSPHAGMDHGPGTTSAAPLDHGRDTLLPAHPDRTTHPDCAYCPLLGSLDQLAPQTPPLSPVSSAASPTAAATIPPRNWRHPNGLGSRGPPTALQPHHPT
jgi:hypothetical protein